MESTQTCSCETEFHSWIFSPPDLDVELKRKLSLLPKMFFCDRSSRKRSFVPPNLPIVPSMRLRLFFSESEARERTASIMRITGTRDLWPSIVLTSKFRFFIVVDFFARSTANRSEKSKIASKFFFFSSTRLRDHLDHSEMFSDRFIDEIVIHQHPMIISHVCLGRKRSNNSFSEC